MKLTCRLIDEHTLPERYIHSVPIEQTSLWGVFQDTMPDRTFLGVLGVYDQERLVALAVPVHIVMRGYSYIWMKQGPCIFDEYDSEKVFCCLKKQILKEVGKKQLHQPLFTRIHSHTQPFGSQPAFTHYIRKTLQIDLRMSCEEILSQMKQKGRYNIKVAQKNGVEVVSVYANENHFEKYFDDFYTILHDTGKRDGFSIHEKKYYHSMLTQLGSACCLYVALKDGVVIAGIIVTFWGDTALYYYGASADAFRNIMAPYLLQWQAIQDAKHRGCKVYDFLGISSIEGDSLAGVTSFKKKFGGNEISYERVYDIIHQPLKYMVMKVVKKCVEYFCHK